MKFRHALALFFRLSAARWRTPSGSPSPQISGERIALCRSSIKSHTACPTKWFETENAVSPLSVRVFHCSWQYFLDSAAALTSKWSPQQASSSPSKPIFLARGASSLRGKSAHWPVNKVTGLAMVIEGFGGLCPSLWKEWAHQV